ncbi:MAG: hypothetical protein JNL94_00385 [Planctomycetes bacterium]|nr:hypothetical protein [Planctomycetota bacterium]
MSLALALALFASLPLGQSPAKPQVSLRSALRVDGVDVVAVESAARALPQAELAKIAADPKLLAALNDKHLMHVATIESTTPVAIGGAFLGAGSHSIALAVSAQGLTVRLGVDGDSMTFGEDAVSSDYVARPTFTITSANDGATYALAIAFAHWSGTLPIRVGNEVVADMNNVAFDLLQQKDATAAHARNALRLARIASEATELREPRVLDTFALALFKNGHVDDAIKVQKRALELLPAQDALRAEAQKRLAWFENQKRG